MAGSFIKTDPDNRFRNAQNNLYSKELFVEFSTQPDVTLYTLKKHDYKGFPSLYRLYMVEAYKSEYAFATKYLDGWQHWEALCKSAWFSPFVTAWRDELAVAKQAEAIERIQEIAASGGKDALTANKYIAERAWEKPRRVGRPNKTLDPTQEAARLKIEELALEDDLIRVNQPVN